MWYKREQMYLKCAVIAHFKEVTGGKNYKLLTNRQEATKAREVSLVFVYHKLFKPFNPLQVLLPSEKKEKKYYPGKYGHY